MLLRNLGAFGLKRYQFGPQALKQGPAWVLGFGVWELGLASEAGSISFAFGRCACWVGSNDLRVLAGLGLLGRSDTTTPCKAHPTSVGVEVPNGSPPKFKCRKPTQTTSNITAQPRNPISQPKAQAKRHDTRRGLRASGLLFRFWVFKGCAGLGACA